MAAAAATTTNTPTQPPLPSSPSSPPPPPHRRSIKHRPRPTPVPKNDFVTVVYAVELTNLPCPPSTLPNLSFLLLLPRLANQL
ncbi:hypothetical protein G6O67_008572 [Ophiocordyceps sinensis]|uniref:Uncharacterized protein n=1 Tax=Ophiocordyceps sinensis TaxID=72228 RepID=A0A8H4LQ89_9HYPO|nr:hypothetical protein G6O67_008572 [Ophiocordyceps sinensis]